MGANRAGDNLRRKQKRHLKNVKTYIAALEKREQAPAQPAKSAKGK